MSKRKEYKPTVDGRASICEWDLKVTFKSKEQVKAIIKKIIEYEIDVNFSYRSEMTALDVVHILEIENFSWASNLVSIAKDIEKCDYYVEY